MCRQKAKLSLAVVLLGLCCSQVSRAVIIIEKNVKEPVRGYLVEEDDVRVVVDVLLPNGSTKQRILPKTSIEEMIRAVSKERLEALNRDRPQEYRDYAEELAGKTNDPEAQRTAIRLYQIAAYLAPEKLGRSALLGMVSLARSPEEARKFRAVAYLMDPAHDRSVLRATPTIPRSTAKSGDDQRRHLQNYLRLLREGRFNDARGLIKRPEILASVQALAPELATEDFSKLRQGENLPPSLMLKVLTVELALDPQAGEVSEERRPESLPGWSKVVGSKTTRPAPVLVLEYLTEFNPRECHFRAGKWTQ